MAQICQIKSESSTVYSGISAALHPHLLIQDKNLPAAGAAATGAAEAAAGAAGAAAAASVTAADGGSSLAL